jgi:hypothetical protein
MEKMTILHNPYEDVEWAGDGQYKADHHVHWRGFGDEPADTLDVLADGAELNGHSLPEDDWYEVLGAGSQAENEDPYWGPNGDDSGYHDMSDTNSDYSDRDATELGVDGIIEFPAQEIDDVEHISHLFATSSPQDFGYYPGTGGSDGNYSDLEEALPQVIEDTEHTVMPGRGQVVIPHPSRYMDGPEDWERYLPFFEDYGLEDGLLGLEIFQKGLDDQGGHYVQSFDLEGAFEMWDGLLMETMPERPIWGFAANDCNNSDWGHGAGPDLRWWTVMLSDDEFDPSDQSASRMALFNALEEGRFYISMRDDYGDDLDPEDAPVPPRIESFSIEDDVVDLDLWWAEDEGTIDWYSNGDVVETGSTIELTDEHIPYVRAHAYTEDTTDSGDPDAHIATQPITVVDDDYEPPDDDDDDDDSPAVPPEDATGVSLLSNSEWTLESDSEWTLRTS